MTTILDDVLLALEETAAESKPERAALLLAGHNMLVRQRDEEGREERKTALVSAFLADQSIQPPRPDAEIDNREDPEE